MWSGRYWLIKMIVYKGHSSIVARVGVTLTLAIGEE
jgi:hypothetical protein